MTVGRKDPHNPVEENIVRSLICVTLGTLLAVIISPSAFAGTDLTGKWSGLFKGVQIEIPPERGPFGYARPDGKATPAPRYLENTLQLEIESESRGLAAGTWTSGEFQKRFVCAQTSTTIWTCIDSGGRSTVEATAPGEIKVCYFDNREGAQGAGCAFLQKSK
jgi:hypothetical protein